MATINRIVLKEAITLDSGHTTTEVKEDFTGVKPAKSSAKTVTITAPAAPNKKTITLKAAMYDDDGNLLNPGHGITYTGNIG